MQRLGPWHYQCLFSVGWVSSRFILLVYTRQDLQRGGFMPHLRPPEGSGVHEAALVELTLLRSRLVKAQDDGEYMAANLENSRSIFLQLLNGDHRAHTVQHYCTELLVSFSFCLFAFHAAMLHLSSSLVSHILPYRSGGHARSKGRND